MTQSPDGTIGKIGTLDIVKFEGTGLGHAGAVFDPDAKFINMNFDGQSLEDAFYIIRWETDHDRIAAAPILGAMALAENDTRNYLHGSNKWEGKVPAEILSSEAIADNACIGIRVEQHNQTLLWRLPILDDPSAVIAAFLSERSDVDRIAQLAQETSKPEQLDYVLEHLPLFHQAYAEYAHLVIA